MNKAEKKYMLRLLGFCQVQSVLLKKNHSDTSVIR